MHLKNIIDEFSKERKSRDVATRNNEEKDFWDLLMDFEGSGKDEPWKMSDKHINSFIMVSKFIYWNKLAELDEAISGGTDTTVSTVEWVMTEVARNREVMSWKDRDEISHVVGYNRNIEESDIGSLPYLGADSASWDNPFSSNPDRFLGDTTDYRGIHSRFLPFGAGRRMFPGLSMVHQILPMLVGSLLQSFDWTLENGVAPESINMNGKIEMSLKKSTPLRIIPRASPLAV
ncbi:cytochrome P450 76A1-like [Papaver somniferum]|uniref:cytochrome P450 76A1-like n=1 Tax=Papaver somniferum TaxID=3469 RepID=UPI000E6FAC34|nr:cytochrome P450 76A1-like [Papaver somniferum]